MLAKNVEVEILDKKFPKQTPPAYLKAKAGSTAVDMAAALHMLGSLTVPGGFTLASPARYWAQVRYFSAIATMNDLRIVGPFIDLDPHQKTILSDDFGVAISTQWLHDALGGFSNVVDGRQFLLQYSSLVSNPPLRKPRKVGPGKCPDFVILDRNGKWHVLECKGTQSSRDFRNRQLKNAYLQKKGIGITASVAGDSLAIGVFVGNERGGDATHVRVIDPPTADALVVVDDRHRSQAETAVRRLSIARAFGLSGLHEVSEELSLPRRRDDRFARLYLGGELQRLARPVKERESASLQELAAQTRTQFSEGNERYEGVVQTIAIPGEQFHSNTGYRHVTVKRGINIEVLEQSRSIQVDLADRIDEVSSPFLGRHAGVAIDTHVSHVSLREGDLYLATMEFH